MTNLDQWNEVAAEEVSTAQLDELAKLMNEQWNEVEKAKKAAEAVRETYDQTESRLLELLKKAGKTKYVVEGLGTLSISTKFMVRTPKTPEEKQALFNFIRESKGPEVLMGLVSINSNTLNSFVNEEKKVNPLVSIPGLEAPTARETLSFRSERK